MGRDFTVDNHGSIFILIPHTQEAKEFVAEKIQEDALEFGGGVVVEHRYIVELVDGIRKEGFGVNN